MSLSRAQLLCPTGLALTLIVACAGPASQGSSEVPDVHDRPIVEREGKTLLWANDEEWFDVTDAAIDPHKFQFGIGKDTIDSIDEPVFAPFGDPRVAAGGIDRDTPVLGIEIGGETRAYPVNLMSMHEIVNDSFAGDPYAILW